MLYQFRQVHRWLPVLFFTAFLITGIIIHRDYGISWDEPLQRSLGLATWDYVSGTNNDLTGNDNRYLNPVIGLLEVLPEKILQIKSERAIYLSRHLFNFLFCWVGMIFFFLLAMLLFKDYRFALLSCMLFLLTPRLFAHCFYNSKDLPFLFLFVANIFLLISWFQKPSWKTILFMVICSGMLTGARMAGLLFPLIFLLAIASGFFIRGLKKNEMKMIIGYAMLYPISVYFFFPTFWSEPYIQFIKAFEITSRHPYEVTTFFMGEVIHSLDSPWYYIPVWMGTTIPLGWWLFFAIGIISIVMGAFKKPVSIVADHWLIIMIWLLLPLITIISFHSSVYDDGRHLFFIYPAFLLIAVYGIRTLVIKKLTESKLSKIVSRPAAVIFFGVTAAYVISFMIRFHPYQYAYFNAIGRRYATEYFEKDYWGLSYRNALEFLVKYDQGSQINVQWKVDPGEWNLAWLNDYDRNRIYRVKSYQDCNYYITNYRTSKPQDASGEKVFEARVQGITIVAVYKMNPPNTLTGSPP
ncbi:MAG: hypothetical protein ABIQ74_07035 [Chitinophagales bacterium]